MTFWHEQITDKSFALLQSLRNEFRFILIGGWAVYFHTQALKSKDIDMIVEFGVLGTLKTHYDVKKNERLKKYEIPQEGFDIDIYVPGWSALGLPVSYITKHTQSIEGFIVPQLEVVLIMKCHAYQGRKGSLKGQKDALDIISLLTQQSFNENALKNHLRVLNQEYLLSQLRDLLDLFVECPELQLNQKKFADEKRRVKKLLQGDKG